MKLRLTRHEEIALSELVMIMGGMPKDWKKEEVQYLVRNELAGRLNNGRVCITDLGRSVNNEAKS